MVIDLDDYRELIALDRPFARPAAADPPSVPALVTRLLTTLHGEGLTVPANMAGQPDRTQLRALLTVRTPGVLPDSVLHEIDALLQLEHEQQGSVAHRSLGDPGTQETTLRAGDRCTVWRGDITRLQIDAIVNAANDRMLGCFVPFHACIDNAIHDKAGPRLRADCAAVMGKQGHHEPQGEAKATRAYNLPSRFVLHTVGPIVRGRLGAHHVAALERCYESCLSLAARIGATSIALCGISTGLYGFPKAEAAAVATATVHRWLTDHPHDMEHVVFNVFDSESFDVYASALSRTT